MIGSRFTSAVPPLSSDTPLLGVSLTLEVTGGGLERGGLERGGLERGGLERGGLERLMRLLSLGGLEGVSDLLFSCIIRGEGVCLT